MNKISKIVVIDSGVCCDAISVKDLYEIEKNEGIYRIVKTDQMTDGIGHGTAVCDIIYQYNKEIELSMFKISYDLFEIGEDELIFILEYIRDNLDIDIINISAGITYIMNFEKLKSVCQDICEKGTLIVSAFDNDGSVSYPAALEDVIGVDVTDEYDDVEDIVKVYNGIVDVYLPNKYYRTIWNGNKTLIKGTSFAAAKLTAILANELKKTEKQKIGKESLLESISNKNKVLNLQKPIEINKKNIQKAIIFPLNKESNALLRFKQYLKFEIVDIYDVKVSGNVGRQIDQHLIVKNYDQIDWEGDFDTVILSCHKKLEEISKKNYEKEILNKAIQYNKSIYSFEEIETDYEKYFYPKLYSENINYKNGTKLNKISVPCVCVLGTSSKQGKYSLQLELKYKLQELGYNVGHIATEPSGYLLDADYVFHFGYNSNLDLQPMDYISILNYMMFETQKKGKDIIITGCQSGILHYDNSDIREFPIYQYMYLLGIMPDAVILCVNPHDELEYIERVLTFIKAVCGEIVIALVMYPIETVGLNNGMSFKSKVISHEEFQKKKESFMEITDIPLFLLGDQEDMKKISERIINFF